MVNEAAIKMTRAEAERFMRAIDKSLKSATFQCGAINRKKTWTPAQKAMECAPYRQQMQDLGQLRALIGTYFNLGGY